MDLGHWEYPGEFCINDWFGFIYRIIEVDSGMHYIGKKQFHSYLKKTVKGRKNKKSVIKENDWKSYTSSSVRLNDEIIKKGISNYVFLIESLHKSRGSLFYAEVERQVSENVLTEKLDNGKRKYYNGVISGVKFIPPDEVSDETRMKISHTLKLRYENKDNYWFNQMSLVEQEKWKQKYLIGNNHPKYRGETDEEIQEFINQHYVGKNNPMYGRSGELSPRFGMSMSADTKQKISEKLTGRELSDEHKDHIKTGMSKWLSSDNFVNHKEMLSNIMSGENNPMFGKPCHYKMTEIEKEQWKKNVGNSVRGLTRSDETKKKMSDAQKGLKKPTIICPHCKKEGAKGNMMRYHFDNCKLSQINK
jgi:hypothetical protein